MDKLPHRRQLLTQAAALGLVSLLPASVFAAASSTGTQPAGKPQLRPGDFYWHPEIAPAGPLIVLVSLDEQRLYVYRNGIAIAASTISSGKEGHETPTGVFTILQKSKDHRSNLYNNAPMPYMQRLTWDGIALHGGSLPGYPASHGCVRLPHKFAQKLFSETRRGDTVVVSNAKMNPAAVAFPALLAPVASDPAQLPAALVASFESGEFWDPSLAPDNGPVSILASLAEQRVYVLRDGIVIGAAPLVASPEARFDGTLLLVMGEEILNEPSPLDPQRQRHHWTSYALLGNPPELNTLEDGIKAPPEFMQQLYDVLKPGTTILVTSLPAVRPEPLAPGAAPPARILESDY